MGFFGNIEEKPQDLILDCETCGRYKKAKNPKLKVQGSGESGILNLGGMPSVGDDLSGIVWSGSTGEFMRETYDELGIDLDRHCYNMHSIACYSPGAQATPKSIPCCREVMVKPALKKEIAPFVIIPFGMDALMSLMGERWNGSWYQMGRWRGTTIPDYKWDAWICPMYEPGKVQQVDKVPFTRLWKQDLKRAFSLVDKELPEPVSHDTKLVFPDTENVGDALWEFCKDASVIAFDYETTGVKPHEKGHRIYCVSVAKSEDEVLVAWFPDKPDDPMMNGWRAVLRDDNIAKVAHNLEYEIMWSGVWLDEEVRNAYYDTMLMAHHLDNRSNWTSLKYQALIQFGIDSYNTPVDPYMKMNKGSTFNKLDELANTAGGKTTIMNYCAKDTAVTYRLFWKQLEEIGLEERIIDEV